MQLLQANWDTESKTSNLKNQMPVYENLASVAYYWSLKSPYTFDILLKIFVNVNLFKNTYQQSEIISAIKRVCIKCQGQIVKTKR